MFLHLILRTRCHQPPNRVSRVCLYTQLWVLRSTHWIWYATSFSHSLQHIAHPKASSALEIRLSRTWGCTATKLLLCSRYRRHCTCCTIAYFTGYCPADDLQWNHKQSPSIWQSLNTLETSLFFKVISQPPHEQVQWYTQFSPKQERFVVSQTVVQQDIRSSVECRSQSLF